MRNAQLGPAEHVDDVERPGRLEGLTERPERRHPQDRSLAGVDRHALVALVEEVAEDAERGTGLIGGGAHDGDPPGGTEEVRDLLAVKDRDRASTLIEVEVRDRPGSLGRALRRPLGGVRPRIVLVAQVADSRSYGWPSAAGGVLRPTTPARTMIVTMYGKASNSWAGTADTIEPS